MNSSFPLNELVQQINTAQRTTFIAGDRYSMGEQGAYALLDAQGQRFVLKENRGIISSAG